MATELCTACSELVGKLKAVQPHEALTLVDSVSLSRSTMGNAKGSLETYSCKTCGATLTRDTDRHDNFAGWGLKKLGKKKS